MKYNNPFHGDALNNRTFLITGGAGFIGSGICEYLLEHGAAMVRVLDNLSEGRQQNIQPWIDRPNFEFIEGDITDPKTCAAAVRGIDLVSHQAALGSVPRSIANPQATHDANVTGFLNMLTASRDAGVRRFVYASSSSVYGDHPGLPKREAEIGQPLSPYAASKRMNEIYADVFRRVYNFPSIGLRYFNVFGPRQKPDGPYAAVIPLFMDALLKGDPAHINGDGEQSRDFTFLANAVEANIRAMVGAGEEACGRVYNVAFGQRRTINQLYAVLQKLVGSEAAAVHRDPRPGDVRDSLADISLANEHLGYQPQYDIDEGLSLTLQWFRGAFGN